MPESSKQTSSPVPSKANSQRVTLRTLRQWVAQAEPFALLTCYDATTAALLYKGGVRVLLVGDTAAQVILGHDSTLPAPMDFMLQITAAVRRGAPDAYVIGDMPFGSYQCGDDLAMQNAVRFLSEARADAVKVEVDASMAPLVKRMSLAGIPVVAHLGSRPQQVRVTGGYRAAGRSENEAAKLYEDVTAMLQSGATMLLLEAVPAEVSQKVVEMCKAAECCVPVIGCGAGPACHGHVVVLHDLLGMTAWQPPFAKPMVQVGTQIQDAAGAWVKLIASGNYLKHDHPYTMQSDKSRTSR